MTQEKPLSEKVKGFGRFRKKIKKGYYTEEDVKQALQGFANILKNNKNPEFKEYNQMLLNSLKEIFGKDLVEND